MIYSLLVKGLFFATALNYSAMGQDKAAAYNKPNKNKARNQSQVILSSSPSISSASNTPAFMELNYLQPRTYWLEDIQIVGAKSLDPEALIAMSGLSVGDFVQIPGPSITGAIEKLWQQKLIKDVAIYVTHVVDSRISLTIHIVESPRLSNYTFQGVTKREKKKLADKINLVRGKIITSKLIKSLKKNIKKYFLDLGYRNIRVEIVTIPDPLDTAYSQLQIQIYKGEKTIINKIIIQGNNHVDSDLLRAQLDLQEKPQFTVIKDVLYKICTLEPIRKGGILWNLPDFAQTMAYLKSHAIFSSSKFTQSKYVADKKRLVRYYQNKGYRDAAIVKEVIEKNRKGWLNISLQIEEGQKYYIRNIKWVGNYLHASRELNKFLAIKPGSVYSNSLLEERLYFNPHGKDVSSIYMDDGYLFFRVEPIEVGIEGNQVDLELRIHEGTQATVNQIIIRGNHYTHEEVIRRELKILPGDKFSRAKLIRSQRELAMLNIFDPNKIQITPLPNAVNNTVDVLFKVKESLKFDARLSGSLAAQSRPIVSIEVGTNNFSLANALRWKLPIGDLQTAHLKAEFTGKHRQEFSLKFVEPWLTGKTPTAFDFSISKSFHQYANEDQTTNNQKENEKGYLGSFSAKTGLGKRLTWPDDYFTLRTGLKYQLYKYNEYNVFGDNRLLKGITHEVCLDMLLERSTLDQPTYPTSGSLVVLQTKMTPPYSWFLQQAPETLSLVDKLKKKEYIQTILDFGYFYNVWGDWVVNVFAHGGALGSYSRQQGVGPFERFSMGGRELPNFSLLGKEFISLRGYSAGSLTPKNRQGYDGGVLFEKVGLELRHPIIKSSMFFVYALLFAEAGNVWAHYKDWRFLDIKQAVGLGLRFYLPIGLIGLDWGYGFDGKKEMDNLKFHWSFGGGIR